MKILSILLTILILFGCTPGNNKPSVDQIKELVTGNLLSGGGDKIIKIENFKKVNGFVKDNNTYVADVQYDIVFLKSIDDLARSIKKKSRSGISVLNDVAAVNALKIQFGYFGAGFRVNKEDKITLINTENGWRILE